MVLYGMGTLFWEVKIKLLNAVKQNNCIYLVYAMQQQQHNSFIEFIHMHIHGICLESPLA
jgi:hypothetical protein